MAAVADVTGARKEAAAEFVEGHRHDSVGGQERLLHPVPVMDVNVHVQHSRMILQQLKDRQNYVIHVAESRRLHTAAAIVSGDHLVGRTSDADNTVREL